MPIYEYKCRKCGKQFEAVQDITDDAVKECKFCKGTVDKLISLSSFQLKGSGWYVTDYGGKKPSASETKEETPSVTEKNETSKE
ncbi:MAG: zinc ribbon domain-containing protein [Thermodesulfobacteriota bacterium]|nr:zinc ribbon domain-containing protein [Thermodesulfobacteriota bacterium]